MTIPSASCSASRGTARMFYLILSQKKATASAFGSALRFQIFTELAPRTVDPHLASPSTVEPHEQGDRCLAARTCFVVLLNHFQIQVAVQAFQFMVLPLGVQAFARGLRSLSCLANFRIISNFLETSTAPRLSQATHNNPSPRCWQSNATFSPLSRTTNTHQSKGIG